MKKRQERVGKRKRSNRERFKIIIGGCALAGDSDWDADRRIDPSGISDSGDRRDLGVVYIKTAVKSERAIKKYKDYKGEKHYENQKSGK